MKRMKDLNPLMMKRVKLQGELWYNPDDISLEEIFSKLNDLNVLFDFGEIKE